MRGLIGFYHPQRLAFAVQAIVAGGVSGFGEDGDVAVHTLHIVGRYHCSVA